MDHAHAPPGAAHEDLAEQLLDALRPLIGLLRASRTLSPGKIGILRHLADRGPDTASVLAGSIGVSQQAVSLAAKELEGLGLIERDSRSEDRRKVWFRVTAQGRSMIEAEAGRGRAALEALISARLSPDEVRTLAAAAPLLARLTDSDGGALRAG